MVIDCSCIAARVWLLIALVLPQELVRVHCGAVSAFATAVSRICHHLPAFEAREHEEQTCSVMQPVSSPAPEGLISCRVQHDV
jgi:hypothetical protein